MNIHTSKSALLFVIYWINNNLKALWLTTSTTLLWRIKTFSELRLSLQNHFRMYQKLKYSLDKTSDADKNVYLPF